MIMAESMMDKFRVKEPLRTSDVNAELSLEIYNSVGLFKKLKLKILGSVYIGHLQMEGWSTRMPFYLFRCVTHGLEVGYPSGYSMNLLCMDCLKERLSEIPDPAKLLRSLHPLEDEIDEEAKVKAFPITS